MKRCLVILVLWASPVWAASDTRFAQPVRAGELVGQKLIGAVEAQPLLGSVEAVDRLPDGSVALRVKRWSLLPWRRATVTVPLAAVSYLGPQLALTGLSNAELAALPAAGAAAAAVPADERLTIGLVKPFH